MFLFFSSMFSVFYRHHYLHSVPGSMTSDQLGPHHKPIKVVSVFVNQKHVGGWKNRAQIISAILFLIGIYGGIFF